MKSGPARGCRESRCEIGQFVKKLLFGLKKRGRPEDPLESTTGYAPGQFGQA